MTCVRLFQNVLKHRPIKYADVFTPFFGSVTYSDVLTFAVFSIGGGIVVKPPLRGIRVHHKHKFCGWRALKRFVNDVVERGEIVFSVARPHRTAVVHIVNTAVGQTHKVDARAVHTCSVIGFKYRCLFAQIHHRCDFFAVYNKIYSVAFFYYLTFGKLDSVVCLEPEIYAAENISVVFGIGNFHLVRAELKHIRIAFEIIGCDYRVSVDVSFASFPLRRRRAFHEFRRKPGFHNLVLVGNVFASEINAHGKIFRNVVFGGYGEREFDEFACFHAFRKNSAVYREFR